MAQLTNLWLRMCADNSIDRRCSTDTAYPFHNPLRPRLIPSRNREESSGVVSRRYDHRVRCEAEKGRKEREGVVEHRRCNAALTSLTSPTFPDDPGDSSGSNPSPIAVLTP